MTTSAPTLTRRERQRQATYDEIVDVSRAMLRAHNTLSLRGIAQEMGMTAPALYRYVDSYQQLEQLVAASIFDDVVAVVIAARDRYPEDDPAARILCAAVSFRRWALAHRDEFSLIFANPAIAETHTLEDFGEPGRAFGEVFGEMFLRLWQRYEFAIPADEELDPEIRAAMESDDEPFDPACDLPGAPLGLKWCYVQAWARLYGSVTLEVFGHLDDRCIGGGALFKSMLDDMAYGLALTDDWPRIKAIVIAEMTG